MDSGGPARVRPTTDADASFVALPVLVGLLVILLLGARFRIYRV